LDCAREKAERERAHKQQLCRFHTSQSLPMLQPDCLACASSEPPRPASQHSDRRPMNNPDLREESRLRWQRGVEHRGGVVDSAHSLESIISASTPGWLLGVPRNKTI